MVKTIDDPNSNSESSTVKPVQSNIGQKKD